MIIAAASVGIGTTTPTAPLEVRGADSGITISSASANRPHLRLVNGTTNMFQLSANGTYAAIGDGTDANRYMGFYAGKVGVNTIAPDANLDIKSAGDGNNVLMVRASDNDVLFNVRQSANDCLVRGYKDGGSQTWQIHSDGASYFNGGSVGIGTASPDTNLHVYTGSSGGSPYNATGLTVENNGRANIHILHPNGSDGYLFFGDANAGNRAYVGHYGSAQSPANQMVFYSAGNFEFANGKVGIGTTGPARKLEVYGDTSNWCANFRCPTDGYGVTIGNRLAAGTGYAAHLYWSGGDAGSFTIQPYSYTNSSARSLVLCPSGGSVGIGTTAPSEKLDVEGSLVLNVATGSGLGEEGIFFRRGYSTSYTYNVSILAFAHDGSGNFSDGISINGYDGVSFCTGSNSRLERMRIVGGSGSTSGYVGIGTTAPTGKLQVKSGQAVFDDSTDAGAPSITFEGDLDTGFLREGANIIGVTTGGVRRWSIGNGSMTSQITGGARIVQTAGTAAIPAFSFNDDGDTGMYRGGTNILAFTTEGVQRVVIDNGGRMAIGVATPAATLHIKESTTKNEMLYLEAKNDDPYADIVASDSGGSIRLRQYAGQFQVHTGGNANTQATGAALALTIAGDLTSTFGGNVDITRSATTLLTIQGASSGYVNAGIVLKATSDTNYRGLGVYMHDAGGDTEWYTGRPYASSDQYIIARKASQASHDDAVAQVVNALLTIKSDGKVGIGTNAPARKLHVLGGAVGVQARLSAPSGWGTGLEFYDGDTSGRHWRIGTSQNVVGDFTFMSGTSTGAAPTTTRVSILADGNVGIGSASPAAPLDVPRASDYKVIKLGDDITSHYVLTGNQDHTLTLTCGSYYQAEIVITAHQTNGGTYNNLYIRGIWSNNDTSHHWDEIENVGSLTNSTFTITNGQNGATTNSGEWKIVHDYVSGTFVKFTVRITDFYGTHAYTIS